MTVRLHPFLVAVIAAFALAGCAHSPQTRIFTIDPVSPSAGYAAGPNVQAIRVTGFKVQHQLDRVEVVWQEQPNRLEIDDFAHWGAPLGQLARAAFLQDLMQRLPKGTSLNFGDQPDRIADISVEMLSLRRFGAHFEANIAWTIGATATTRALVRTAHYEASASAPGAGGEAGALSVLIGLLADDVARHIATLSGP